jgi:POT family proton-dependent oligopeptide transporter
MNGILKQPKQLYIIAVAEMWDRFNFYGLRALIILYSINVLFFKNNESLNIYTSFLALNFCLPVIGGLLADRFFGLMPLVIVGMLAIILGNLILISPNLFCFYLGLSLTTIGTGLVKGNLTSLLGKLSPPKTNQAETRNSIFYFFMNIGAALGPLFFGIIIYLKGWQACFLISAAGTSLSLLWLLKNYRSFKLQTIPARLIIRLGIGLSLTTALLVWLFDHPIASEIALLVVVFLTVVLAIRYSLRTNPHEKKVLLLLTLYTVYCIFFFSCQFQIGSSLTFFISSLFQYNLTAQYTSAVAFNAIEPFILMLIFPVFILLYHRYTKRHPLTLINIKMILGLFFTCCSFFMFSFATHFQDHVSVAIIFVLLGYVMLAIGEIHIIPSMISAITQLSPQRWIGTIMGIWMMTIALASYLAKSMSLNFSTTPLPSFNFNHTFTTIALTLLIVTLSAILLHPLTHQLIHNNK